MLKKFVVIGLMVLSLALHGCVSGASGLKPYVDSIDGYQFLYPNGWISVKVPSGPDVVFRDLIQETENVSVVVSSIAGDKQLTDLGDPDQVGQRLAQRVIAPPGSGRKAELISAIARQSGLKTYYDLEYAIKLANQERHNLASVAVSRGKLYTLSVSAPEERWPRVQNLFEQVVNSFSVY
jgi:photosystem II oxygen-evolving enhancer protein 2